MRFKYSTTDSSQNECDSLPRLPLILRNNDQAIEVVGLVDSGAAVNVLPYDIGTQLGGSWVSLCQPNLIDCGHDYGVELALSVGII
jgi:hypothetical protein